MRKERYKGKGKGKGKEKGDWSMGGVGEIVLGSMP